MLQYEAVRAAYGIKYVPSSRVHLLHSTLLHITHAPKDITHVLKKLKMAYGVGAMFTK